MPPTPRLEYSERFAEDLAHAAAGKVEARIYAALDNVEASGGFRLQGRARFGTRGLRRWGAQGRGKPVNLVYTYYPDDDLVRIEALVHQRAVR